MDEQRMRKKDINNFLNICCGNSDSVAIKYYGAYNTRPMPVIMLSNFQTDVPMKEERWQVRVAQFKVKRVSEEFGKNFSQQVHPMGWLALFDEEL